MRLATKQESELWEKIATICNAEDGGGGDVEIIMSVLINLAINIALEAEGTTGIDQMIRIITSARDDIASSVGERTVN